VLFVLAGGISHPLRLREGAGADYVWRGSLSSAPPPRVHGDQGLIQSAL